MTTAQKCIENEYKCDFYYYSEPNEKKYVRVGCTVMAWHIICTNILHIVVIPIGILYGAADVVAATCALFRCYCRIH